MEQDTRSPSSKCAGVRDQLYSCTYAVRQLENCQVTANIKHVNDDKSEYHAVQVAATDKADKNTSKAMKGHFRKASVASKQIVKEFPVTPDAHVPVGMSFDIC
jgi:large subunit ribosomal protein L3